jgi:hypothetical protein
MRRPPFWLKTSHDNSGIRMQGRWWARSSSTRPAQRLAPGRAVMANIFSKIAATPWARAALRYGAIALGTFLFLLSTRRTRGPVGQVAPGHGRPMHSEPDFFLGLVLRRKWQVVTKPQDP